MPSSKNHERNSASPEPKNAWRYLEERTEICEATSMLYLFCPSSKMQHLCPLVLLLLFIMVNCLIHSRSGHAVPCCARLRGWCGLGSSAQLDGGQWAGRDVTLGWPEDSVSHPDITNQSKDRTTASILLLYYRWGSTELEIQIEKDMTSTYFRESRLNI